VEGPNWDQWNCQREGFGPPSLRPEPAPTPEEIADGARALGQVLDESTRAPSSPFPTHLVGMKPGFSRGVVVTRPRQAMFPA
jgi:hypothetical protein